MKNKSNKYTEADLIIVNRFGDSVKEIYGDDYTKLKGTVERLKMQYENKIKAEALSSYEKLKPKIDDFIESQKSLQTEIISEVNKKNEPSIAEKILTAISSINENIRRMTGLVAQGAESVMQDLFNPISLIMIGTAIAPVTAGSVRGAAKKELLFTFIGEQERKASLIAADETVSIEITCKDPGKIFYLIGNDDALKSSQDKGVVTFHNVNPGFYILSEDLKWYKGIEIRTERDE